MPAAGQRQWGKALREAEVSQDTACRAIRKFSNKAACRSEEMPSSASSVPHSTDRNSSGLRKI